MFVLFMFVSPWGTKLRSLGQMPKNARFERGRISRVHARWGVLTSLANFYARAARKTVGAVTILFPGSQGLADRGLCERLLLHHSGREQPRQDRTKK